MTDRPPRPDAPPQLQFTMDESVAMGAYVNIANIIHNPTEFVLDFGRVVPGRTEVKILSRVLMSPVHAKQLLAALGQNVALFEKNFGTIRTDFDPASGVPGQRPPFN